MLKIENNGKIFFRAKELTIAFRESRAKKILVSGNRFIIQCNKIGITSGASAPEQLVQNLILELKKHRNILIEEIVLTKENVE